MGWSSTGDTGEMKKGRRYPSDWGRGVKRGEGACEKRGDQPLSQRLLHGAAFYECIVWEVMD